MLRKRKRPKMGVRKPSQFRSLEHLRFVRLQPCNISGSMGHCCIGPMQACHVRTGTDGGAGVKPSDYHTISLCAGAHAEQHSIGESAFEKRYGIDMRNIAAFLWKISPARMRMERENG